MNLYNLSKYFLKLSALEWQEDTHWVPEKFKQHKAFKDYPFKNALKIFKKFGLNDFRVEVDIGNAVEDQKKHVLNNKLLPKIHRQLNNVYEGLRILYLGKRFQNNENIRELIELNREYIDAIKELFDNILENNESNILNKNYDIKGFKFQKGQSIFRIYVSLQKKLEILQKEIKSDKLLPDLDNIDEFKEFSQININTNKKYYLVFSTKQSDICGIGSRGILSCQNLFNEMEEGDSDYHEQLIGSILSRYVGTCYITSGSDFKGRGEKMMFRALIRLIINGKTNQPEILIDRLYPNRNIEIIEIIKNELSKRTNLTVVDSEHIPHGKDSYYIKDESHIPTKNITYTDSVQPKFSSKRIKELVHSPDRADRLEAINQGELKDVIELVDDSESEIIWTLGDKLIDHDIQFKYGNILKQIIENEQNNFENTNVYDLYLTKLINNNISTNDIKFIKTLNNNIQNKITLYMKDISESKYKMLKMLGISTNLAEHTDT